MEYAWTCRCCGKQYNTLPLDVAFKAPDYWLQIPEAEREQLGKLGDDACVIEEDLFIRGCLEIPIIDRDDRFIWGVWVSVSRESFKRILDLWTAEDLEDEPPKFGWLSNQISPYPDTLNLKTHIWLRNRNRRPFIELEPTDHPLAIEQREGMTLARVEEIVAAGSRH
jgi:hypothetical protein